MESEAVQSEGNGASVNIVWGNGYQMWACENVGTGHICQGAVTTLGGGQKPNGTEGGRNSSGQIGEKSCTSTSGLARNTLPM